MAQDIEYLQPLDDVLLAVQKDRAGSGSQFYLRAYHPAAADAVTLHESIGFTSDESAIPVSMPIVQNGTTVLFPSGRVANEIESIWQTDGTQCGTEQVLSAAKWSELQHEYGSLQILTADDNSLYLLAGTAQIQLNLLAVNRQTGEAVAKAIPPDTTPTLVHKTQGELMLHSPSGGLYRIAAGDQTYVPLDSGRKDYQFPEIYESWAYYGARTAEDLPVAMALNLNSGITVEFPKPYPDDQGYRVKALKEGFFSVTSIYENALILHKAAPQERSLDQIARFGYVQGIWPGGPGQLWFNNSPDKYVGYATLVDRAMGGVIFESSNWISRPPYLLEDGRYVVTDNSTYGWEPHLLDTGNDTIELLQDVVSGSADSNADQYHQVGNYLLFRAAAQECPDCGAESLRNILYYITLPTTD